MATTLKGTKAFVSRQLELCDTASGVQIRSWVPDDRITFDDLLGRRYNNFEGLHVPYAGPSELKEEMSDRSALRNQAVIDERPDRDLHCTVSIQTQRQ